MRFCGPRSATPAFANNSHRTTTSGASVPHFPTATSVRSPRTTCISKRRRSTTSLPTEIVTADGRKTEIDTLVLATGFNLWDVNFPAIEVIGREGRNLGKWWRDNRFQAYEGVAVPYFPNFLTLASPYSYSGLSYFTTIESQMQHMDRLFGEVKRRGAETFEVTETANAEFLDRMTENLADSVFYGGSCQTARSYYFNQHGEAAILRPTSTRNAFVEAKTLSARGLFDRLGGLVPRSAILPS